ncbi:DNA repair protein RecO [Methylocella sp.]|uniref:DNA repair protein RecO n=1 Tax=Methylocella sp. TaxID=1978226 RepID=UPI0037840359
MEWRDEGLVIGVRHYGEASVILEAMTRVHGRHLGLVRGGRSRRLRAVLQQGNSVELVWRARLDEQLGAFAVEPVALRAAGLMESAEALHGIGLAAALLRLLPERDPHAGLYEMAAALAAGMEDPGAPARLVRLELAILRESGFGLDLARCAATGTREDLTFVSPKTGRAVSRAAGAPYADRLLALPLFLTAPDEEAPPPLGDALAGFRLTGAFLERDVLAPRGLEFPPARRAYLAALERRLAQEAAQT